MRTICLLILILQFDISLQFKHDYYLRFELENNSEMCFYHQFHEINEYIFDYGVLNDIDDSLFFYLESPSQWRYNCEYRNLTKCNHNITFKSTISGDFKFCFSNKNSFFSYKIVFFSLRLSNINVNQWDDTILNELPSKNNSTKIRAINTNVLTLIEHLCFSIHYLLSKTEHMQLNYKHYESIGHKFAEFINFNVTYISFSHLIIIVLVYIFQTTVIKCLIRAKKSNKLSFL